MTNQMGKFKDFFFFSLSQSDHQFTHMNEHTSVFLFEETPDDDVLQPWKSLLNCSKMQNLLLKTSTFFIQKAPRKCSCLFFWAYYTSHIGLYTISATFKCIKDACQHSVLTLFLRKWFYWFVFLESSSNLNNKDSVLQVCFNKGNSVESSAHYVWKQLQTPTAHLTQTGQTWWTRIKHVSVDWNKKKRCFICYSSHNLVSLTEIYSIIR